MDKTALFKISYGLYIVSSSLDGRSNGQIANTVFQVTSEPPTIAVAINKQNYTHGFISESKKFSVSVLEKETPMPFIGVFGFRCGRDFDKFAGVNVRMGMGGVPIVLDHAIAFLETEVMGEMDCGTHTIFLGKVVDCGVLAQGEPMTYAYYHEVKGGKSPKTAPTYAG
jgi:flavin reductase (DIM6/NTAB) family NADH-FMN oxidoreductase RutF